MNDMIIRTTGAKLCEEKAKIMLRLATAMREIAKACEDWSVVLDGVGTTGWNDILKVEFKINMRDMYQHGIYDLARTRNLPEEVVAANHVMNQNGWRRVANLLLFRNMMSSKDWEAWEKQLEDPSALPDLTQEAIFAFMANANSNQGEWLANLYKEAMDVILPHRSEYKSNQPNVIGRRLVWTHIVEHGYERGHPVRVRYQSEGKLNVMDRVFHVLDGKTYPDVTAGPLATSIRQATKTDGETDYFRWRAFPGNGNLHLYFKRRDLVALLVQRSGMGSVLVENWK